jgi:hypothetical protein
MVEQLECAAVLDMKWSRARLAVATAKGSLHIYTYREEEEEGSSASDESRLLSLSSELALTDGLALALGEFTVI